MFRIKSIHVQQCCFFSLLMLFSPCFAFVWAKPSGQKPYVLNERECRSLYKKQLELAQKERIALASVLQFYSKELSSKKALAKQKQYCQKNTSIRQYKCQMRTKSLHEFLSCLQAEHKTNSGQPFAGEVRTKMQCQKSYHKILQVLKQYQDFLQRTSKERQQLLQYWNSTKAKLSFQKRCLKKFRSKDHKCIRDAKDMDFISACILAIPE